jgi:hypothetical protein
MSETTRRLFVLCLLLPQLVAVSLGNGFVVCLAPGEHLQVELAASACCSSEAPAASAADVGAGGPTAARAVDGSGSPECPSCEDVVIATEPARPERPESALALQPPSAAPDGLASVSRFRALARAPVDARRGGAQSPHLSRLRTTVLRC